MKLLIALLLACVAISATAAKPENVTEGETALLPPYCVDTEWWKGGPRYSNHMSPRAPYWESLMGDGFYWMHHYCAALVDLRRSQMFLPGSDKKRYLLQAVKMEITFTIAQVSKKFVLLPEMYTRLGEAEIQLSDIGGAYDALSRAREIKPDYWPAYSTWAEVLIRLKKKAEAKKLVREGLEYSPDSKVLLDQYKSLGGDPKEIQPVKKPGPAIDATESTEPAPAAPASTPASDKTN